MHVPTLCDRFLVFLLLLSTPTIWFSLDHERYVSDGVISGIGTLFSLDHKIYASDPDSDSDSDSVASENKNCKDWKEAAGVVEGARFTQKEFWARYPRGHRCQNFWPVICSFI